MAQSFLSQTNMANWARGSERLFTIFNLYPFSVQSARFLSKPKGMASALLPRGFPLRYLTYRSTTASAAAVIAAALSRRHLSGFSDDPSTPPVPQPGPPSPTKSLTDIWIKEPDYRQWKEKEAEMLRDIRPTVQLAKEILHSNRYMDGEELNKEDEEFIILKLLAYHPHAKDKIGCGLQAIMVDKHPQFSQSRCLFVVRTDGDWIDFSYQKCLLAYIRKKYPSYAEKFIKEHFKRSLM